MEGTLNLYYNEQFIRANKYGDSTIKNRILKEWRLLYGKRLDRCIIIDLNDIPDIIRQKSHFKKGSIVHTKTPSHEQLKRRRVFRCEGFK